MPNKIIMNKPDFDKEFAANDFEHDNILIVDTERLNWVEPGEPTEWKNLYFLVFWKKTQKVVKAKGPLVLLMLSVPQRAYLLYYVARKATSLSIGMTYTKN